MLNTATKSDAEKKKGSLTVLFALDVLEVLSARGKAGITEIAQTLHTDKSRVFRVITSLAQRGYVTQQESRKYSLGPSIGNLADRPHDRLVAAARSLLCHLRETFHATAVLRVLDGYHVVVVAVEESSSILRITHQVGARIPLSIGAFSKVFAAYMPEDLVRHILQSQKGSVYTHKKVINITEFIRNLRRVRKQGYGFNDEEVAKGVRSLAAPIRDAEGNVIATIGISVPSFELPNSRIERVAKAVKKASQEVSKRLRME
jgi:DNA-binding IclR family transcriptional regulator